MSEYVRGALFQSPRYTWEYMSTHGWIQGHILEVHGAIVWRKRRRVPA